MTSPYSKTSVFVHLHKNDKRAFKKTHFGNRFRKPAFLMTKKRHFLVDERRKRRKKSPFSKNIGIVFYWPIKTEIHAGRHFRIKIREIVKRDSLQTSLRFPSIFSCPWQGTLFFLVYPSPKPTFCPKWEVSVNIGLGGGGVDRRVLLSERLEQAPVGGYSLIRA